MEYSVQCSCGKSLPVTMAQAGSAVACDCGANVNVPSLSRLKQAAGQAAYEVGILDQLRNLVAEGELPASDQCQQCRDVTSDVLTCTVVCEMPRFKRSKQGQWRWLLLLLWWPIWILVNIIVPDKTPDGDKVREFGREVTIDLPLRMCAPCADKFRRRNRASRALLKFVADDPATAELIREYPNAEVFATSR